MQASSMGTGILIVAHTPLASALKACAMHVRPEYDSNIATFDVEPHIKWMDELENCLTIIEHLTSPQLLIMTDVIGATPYNLGYALLKALAQNPSHRPVQLVSGTNVPMLFRAITYHQKPLDELVKLVICGGVNGIQSAS